MTKVASVWVIGLAAIMAIIIGFLGKFTAFVSTIPNPVLGGVSLLLYGFIGINGLKVLIKNQTDFENPKNVIVASTMLVLGLGGAVIAINSGDLSVTISGMSLAAIIGILLNLVLSNREEVLEEIPVEILSASELEKGTKSESKKTDKKKVSGKENKKATVKKEVKKEITKKASTPKKKDTKTSSKKVGRPKKTNTK